jgi:hypothetical protein
MPALFTLSGWLGLAWGLLGLPAALFVEPHVLAVALGCISFGFGSLIVAQGFRRGKRWAPWIGGALCAAVVSLAALAAVQSAKASQWDSVGVWASVAMWFAVVLIAIFYARKTNYGEEQLPGGPSC